MVRYGDLNHQQQDSANVNPVSKNVASLTVGLDDELHAFAFA